MKLKNSKIFPILIISLFFQACSSEDNSAVETPSEKKELSETQKQEPLVCTPEVSLPAEETSISHHQRIPSPVSIDEVPRLIQSFNQIPTDRLSLGRLPPNLRFPPSQALERPTTQHAIDLINKLTIFIESQDSLTQFAVNNEDKLIEIFNDIDQLERLRTSEIKDQIDEIKAKMGSAKEVLTHHLKIKAAIKGLKEIGFDLILNDLADEFQWSNRNVIVLTGHVEEWKPYFFPQTSNLFRPVTPREYSIIVFPALRALSKSTGDFGKKYKDFMTEVNLKKWRSINTLLLASAEEIKGTFVP